MLVTSSRGLTWNPDISFLTFSSHIHWYERLWPMTGNGTIDKSSIANNNTYYSNPGISMTHIINGMAGNGESHVILGVNESAADITAVLDTQHYGFNKLRVINATALSFSFIQGDNGSVNDELTILKRVSANSTCGVTAAQPSNTTSTAPAEATFTGYAQRMSAVSLANLACVIAFTLYVL